LMGFCIRSCGQVSRMSAWSLKLGGSLVGRDPRLPASKRLFSSFVTSLAAFAPELRVHARPHCDSLTRSHRHLRSSNPRRAPGAALARLLPSCQHAALTFSRPSAARKLLDDATRRCYFGISRSRRSRCLCSQSGSPSSSPPPCLLLLLQTRLHL
jgi:hypothetical protein